MGKMSRLNRASSFLSSFNLKQWSKKKTFHHTTDHEEPQKINGLEYHQFNNNTESPDSGSGHPYKGKYIKNKQKNE